MAAQPAAALDADAVLIALAAQLKAPPLPDPVSLCRAVGIEPDPWQERLLQSPADRILLNCCRQSGKSSMAGLLAISTALRQPGSLVLLLSPTLRQSQELFRKSLAVYRDLGRPVSPDSETKLSLELVNGSRLVSLPGIEHSVRGFSNVALLCIDEAAQVPDDLYYSVRPMLAVSGGKLIALSTPYGDRGWWHAAWVGDEHWERYEVPATECPRIDAAFLAEEERTLGPWWFAQEYCCQFAASDSAAFTAAEVAGAFAEDIASWAL